MNAREATGRNHSSVHMLKDKYALLMTTARVNSRVNDILSGTFPDVSGANFIVLAATGNIYTYDCRLCILA